MKTMIVILLIAAASYSPGFSPGPASSVDSALSPIENGPEPRLKPGRYVAADVRFLAVEIFIDTKGPALAVYQLEFSASANVKIVSIEGGEHAAFNNPPFYDPAAIQQERAILAAFNTADADKLPRGKTRIATLHLQITGDAEPTFHVKPSVTATVGGTPIRADVTVEPKRTQS